MTNYGLWMIVFSLLMMGAITVSGYMFSKKTIDKKGSYFTAGRNVTTAFMTATFIAYAVGTGLIFSPAEMAYYEGLTAMIGYALAISLSYLVFIPVSRKIKTLIPEGHTIGEYVKVRYGNLMHKVVLGVTIVYMFCLLVANLIGVGIAFKYLGNMPIYVGVLIIGIPIIIYTTYGGLKAAIFTNGLQALLITPLLFITAFIGLKSAGGPGAIFDGLMANSPESLNIFRPSGIQFAITIIIGVTAAELLNQAIWQRVFSAKDINVLKKGLISSSIMTFPMTIVAASFGLIAISMNMDMPHPSIATALVTNALLPRWAAMLFVMIIVLAATSTGADALNGFASIASIDVMKGFFPKMTSKNTVTIGRIGVVLFGVGAMLVAFQAPSILTVLLFADLGAAAAVVPVMMGLYKDYISGKAAAWGTILGIVAGLPLFFMKLEFLSFIIALLVSSFVVLVLGKMNKTKYDFSRLKNEINEMD